MSFFPNSCNKVATLLYSLQQMDTSWSSLDPPLRAAIMLGVVASGDVDRLASLEKTKPATLRDNEKKKYGAVNARNAAAAALSDRQKGERFDGGDENGGVEGEAETRSVVSSGLTGQGSGEESKSSSSPSMSEEPALSLDGGFGFDYMGNEVGVSRTRHELARATAGIVHGMAGLQVRQSINHDQSSPVHKFPMPYLCSTPPFPTFSPRSLRNTLFTLSSHPQPTIFCTSLLYPLLLSSSVTVQFAPRRRPSQCMAQHPYLRPFLHRTGTDSTTVVTDNTVVDDNSVVDDNHCPYRKKTLSMDGD